MCDLSPAHKREMKGSLVYLLIVKHLSDRLFFNSATVYQIRRPCRAFEGGGGRDFFETNIVEGSVDHIV